MKYLTRACLHGYKINNGDLSTMTPLQKLASFIITENIFEWKMKNKPFAVV